MHPFDLCPCRTALHVHDEKEFARKKKKWKKKNRRRAHEGSPRGVEARCAPDFRFLFLRATTTRVREQETTKRGEKEGKRERGGGGGGGGGAAQHSTRLRVQVRARQSVARLPYLLPRFFSPFLASPRSSPPRHTLWPTKSHQTCCNLCCWSPLTASLTNPPPPYRPHRCRRRSLRYVFLLSPSP